MHQLICLFYQSQWLNQALFKPQRPKQKYTATSFCDPYIRGCSFKTTQCKIVHHSGFQVGLLADKDKQKLKATDNIHHPI